MGLQRPGNALSRPAGSTALLPSSTADLEPFSGAAFACASKALAESLEPQKELERAVLWLRNLSGSVCEDDVRDCADLLEAAGAVVEYQFRFGISMRVTAVCADGSALRSLASRLREFADALR